MQGPILGSCNFLNRKTKIYRSMQHLLIPFIHCSLNTKSTRYKSCHNIRLCNENEFRAQEETRLSSGKLGIQRGQISWWSCAILPRKRHTLPLYESRTIHAPRSQGRRVPPPLSFPLSFHSAPVNHRFIFSHTRESRHERKSNHEFLVKRLKNISIQINSNCHSIISIEICISMYRKRERMFFDFIRCFEF